MVHHGRAKIKAIFKLNLKSGLDIETELRYN
nr:MAG TPA: hypothetical protein [Caudoviricetes sp.]